MGDSHVHETCHGVLAFSARDDVNQPSLYWGVLLSSSKLAINFDKLETMKHIQKHLYHDDLDLANYDISARRAARTSVDGLAAMLRVARNLPYRIMVVCIAFAGERRAGDIHDHLQALCKAAGMAVLICSLDLSTDERWDLTRVDTFMILLALTEQGLIDIWIGGPPCSTVSR